MKNRGFTLIELLVVISIIGLLASLVLVSLKDVRQKANDAVLLEELNFLQTSAANYYSANNSHASFCAGNDVAKIAEYITGKLGYPVFACYSDVRYLYYPTYYDQSSPTCGKDKWWGYVCKDAVNSGAGPDCYCIDSTGKKGLNPNGGSMVSCSCL